MVVLQLAVIAGSFHSGHYSYSRKKLTGAWLNIEWILVDKEQANPL